MNKYSVILEDLVWTLPNLTDRALAGSLPTSFSTMVDVPHDNENLVIFVARSRCESEAGCNLNFNDFNASVCLIEEDVVN